MSAETTETTNLLGDNIKELRAKRQITQKQLSEATGIPLSTIARLETREAGANNITLLKLSKGLGCTADELLKGVEEGWKGEDDDHIDRLCEELKQLPDEGREQVIHTLQALIVYWKYRRES